MLRRLLAVAAVVFGLFLALRLTLGSGHYLEDRTTPPRFDDSALEVVADLPTPPGNIAVAPDGRIFLSLHPEGRPEIQLAELVDGRPVPFPNEAFQTAEEGTPHFQSVLSLRIDRRNRLWVLDYAHHGLGQPRILAFDLGTRELVHRYDFPSDVAGKLSMLNDFQVGPDGRWVYIADPGIYRFRPGLIVYDSAEKKARRVLDRHESVLPKNYLLHVQGRTMRFFGAIALRIGVDSIALDRDGEWLYYGPVNHDRLFRIRAADLRDGSLGDDELAARVEDYGLKPLSDGISTDDEGNVYLTDPDHSAILTLSPDKKLRTLVKTPRLRWPDGLSFGPDGWLYVTASALHQILIRPPSAVAEHAPYQVFRFQTGQEAPAGH